MGLALGILLASLARSFNVDLMAYLFGDILAIEPVEVWLSVGLAAAVLVAVWLNYAKLLFMTFDRESARVAGVKVGRLDTLLMVLTAVTIVLGMKVAGILLVAALIVIPGRGGSSGGQELSHRRPGFRRGRRDRCRRRRPGRVRGPQYPGLGGDRHPLLHRLRGRLFVLKRGRGVPPAAE